ncbi:hypothetical protein ACB092_08G042400 [Castanea dentata]
MDTYHGDISRYANILQRDSDFVAPFLSGSQDSEMPIQESVPEVEIVSSNPSKRGGNFSVDEDNLLVSAWLNISMDAVQGTDQKADTFWEKVWQYFCENNTYRTTRSVSSTSKFAGLLAKIEARNPSGATDQMKLEDAKVLYMKSSHHKKVHFAFEHCWDVLKNQPKWTTLKKKSKGLPQTLSSIDQVGSNNDDTMVLESPIGRKAEKAKRKRADGDTGFEDYLAKKLQYIQDAQEQEKEALRIKADRVRVEAERVDIEKESHEKDKEALRIKADRVRVDAQRADIEKEMLRLDTIREEGRVMIMETSGMNEKEKLYFENLKDEILARHNLE